MKRYRYTKKRKVVGGDCGASSCQLPQQTGGGCGCGMSPPKPFQGGACPCQAVKPFPIPLGGYRATKRNIKYLKKWKRGNRIGFTMRSSLKAKGLIPRKNGTYRVSKKYIK
jgi:hypothetical protein